MSVRFVPILCAVGLLAFAGCGPAKLDVTLTLSLEAGRPKGQILEVQKKPQKVTIEYTSSASEVSVYVFKTSDADALEEPEKYKDKALATKTGKSETFAVEVPANVEVQVVFWSLKKTEVNAKLTNRK
ncbi:hypothetical protein GobsT_22000 [Gemmata obscuriglobus]|uniref:Uncharacterized protein n=1 Tax=Gemmata obscuriglobus TaxID=114 RepID=A0A2Z3HDV2_9BACT|nr:hypothetical protein [Gemmata obscuriglobus]AWM39470.1 hypothetical protein C1280_22410 [Gemmata obscuriglobus]QEG27444.1 hypothetical protein GobsT_22000 [Gemmata obscuriglobus]VTS04407.1 unnamed protein product [Gemmata obscuriglobus UQM 2246]